MMLTQEAEFIKKLLPEHYQIEPQEKGIYCHSAQGIDDGDMEQWGSIINALRSKFGKRFAEVFHQTNTNHMRFTVYFKNR